MVRLFIGNGVCGVEEYFKLIGTARKIEVFLFCYHKVTVTYQDLKQKFDASIGESNMSKILTLYIDQHILEKLVFNNEAGAHVTYCLTQKAADLYSALNLTQRFCTDWQNIFNAKTFDWIFYAEKLLGSRWNSRIIWLLFVLRNIRFNEMKDSIEGISYKMLSQQLQYLESENALTRTDFHENPPHVEYSLTKKGEALYQVLLEIASWNAKYNKADDITGNERSEIKLLI